MDPLEYLERLMKIESHETVDEIQGRLLETIEGATLHETGCVYAEKTGSGEGPRIVLNTHMDVVSPHVPFERDGDGDVVRGRGACDAKGSLASMATAFSRVDPERGSLALLVSPDEETKHQGLYEYLSDGIEGDFAIVGEPTGLDVCPSARGHHDLEVELFGESAHGATPEKGRNATRCAAEAIVALCELPRIEDETLGTNDVTPTIVEGGNRPNQVPDYTRFVVDYRTVPEETRADAIERVQSVLEGLDCEYEIGRYEEGAALDSFETDETDAYVSEFAEAIAQVTGERAEFRPFDAATEAAFFAPHMPVVVFGPGLISDGDRPIAHSPREYVPVSDVERATEILSTFLSTTLR